ncbi:MAG: hypothetical protein A2Y07_09885 [Planctomycetes bacterium GWF2_50_10]|nr:MAG: hypothetical protein A2Y07_09885 [Planctomycetes bacterium GWF2_50_10]
MYFLAEHNILLFLVQVFVILALARGLGEVFRYFRQVPLTAELLVGFMLGPAVLGYFAPELYQNLFPADPKQQNMLETVAWLGVLLLLLQTGLEIDFIAAWSYRADAVKIAVMGTAIPMVIAFAVAMMLPDWLLINPDKRIAFALFISIVLAISAVPVAARALHDLRLIKTDLGFLIMSALSVNDLIGWLVFTMIMAFFSQARVDVMHDLAVMGMVILFTIICLTVGRWSSSHLIGQIRKYNLPEPSSSLTLICLLGFLCGAITMKIGIHALYGFFIAGIMAGQSSALSERTRQVFSHMVGAIFVPLFFANIGLKINFVDNFHLWLVLLFCILGLAGKFLGAWVGTLLTRITKSDRLSIAIANTPGGSMEIIVALLALQYGLISEPVFTAIVIAAVSSSIVVGPWLAYSIRKREKISVLEFFARSGIIADLRKADRDGAIEKLCTVAAEQEGIADEEKILEAVLERERASGTAMEEEIAVPHARTELVRKPVVVFGRSPIGIDWNSPDGKPTHFVFLILTPKNDLGAQVQILGSIAQAISNEKIRSQILDAGDTSDIWQSLRLALRAMRIKRR